MTTTTLITPNPATDEQQDQIAQFAEVAASKAVKTLKPEQAECVVLRFLQGMSLAETALVIGKSEGAVKQLQLRAMRALHRQLGGEMP